MFRINLANHDISLAACENSERQQQHFDQNSKVNSDYVVQQINFKNNKAIRNEWQRVLYEELQKREAIEQNSAAQLKIEYVFRLLNIYVLEHLRHLNLNQI